MALLPAVLVNGAEDKQVRVIEINPFLETTDGALFSWQHERQSILANSNQFMFRITERARPGAKAMLPFSLRKMMQDNDLKIEK